jgi:hypothetical protein
MAPNLTLGDYAELTPEARLKRVTAAAAGVGADDQVAEFTRCMGEYAWSKDPDVPADDVFGWCDMERKGSPEKFADHFDELDAEDLSITALTACEALVQNQLTSPGAPSSPLSSRIPRGRQRYLVKSTVDAQNALGALLRGHYVCEIQYEGSGDPLVLANWKTHQLVIE